MAFRRLLNKGFLRLVGEGSRLRVTDHETAVQVFGADLNEWVTETVGPHLGRLELSGLGVTC